MARPTLVLWGMLRRLWRPRQSAAALLLLAVMACAAGLAPSAGRSPAILVGSWRVTAGRAPSFGLMPVSRRDDAVLRSPPQLQILGAGTPLARAKLARLQGDRIRHLTTAAGRRRGQVAGHRRPSRLSGAAIVGLRAPPPPAG
jgi:hypothetical protein